MALYVDVRVNRDVVAQAAVQNVNGTENICDYVGRAFSEAFAERDLLTHQLTISGHDRRKSVWLLVAKMALQLAKAESSGDGEAERLLTQLEEA